MRPRRDIYIPPKCFSETAVHSHPKAVVCDISPVLLPFQARRATSVETNPSCRDPDCCFFACFLEKIAGYDLPGDMRGLCVCLCVRSCNEFPWKNKKKKTKKAINDGGGIFCILNPSPPLPLPTRMASLRITSGA